MPQKKERMPKKQKPSKMSTITDLAKQIEESDYWDARVMKLECNYFCDEVELVFEDVDKDISYHFMGCYQVKADHITAYDKKFPYKELSYTQIPYFMQAVDVHEVFRDDKVFKEFVINMFPMTLYILCLDFEIRKIDKLEQQETHSSY